MSVEVHLEWAGATQLVGRLHTAERRPAVAFAHPLMDEARRLA